LPQVVELKLLVLGGEVGGDEDLRGKVSHVLSVLLGLLRDEEPHLGGLLLVVVDECIVAVGRIIVTIRLDLLPEVVDHLDLYGLADHPFSQVAIVGLVKG
jgi:hypothetical protein